MRQLPNVVTAVRLLLTPFLVLGILRGEWRQAFWLGIVAGVTDVLDGLVARLLKVSSRLGGYLDPIADKLMLSASYLALGAARALPWWMVALVFGRDLFILGMCVYGYLFTPIRQFPPSVWGKLSTFAQIIAAMVLVGDHAGIRLPAAPFLWVMVVITAWSGIDYGMRGWNAVSRLPDS